MKVRYFLLGFCFALQANAYAAESPVVAEEVEMELPSGFTAAQPIPLPAQSSEPAERSKPATQILPYQVEAGGSYSKLTNGYQDGGAYFSAEMKLGSRNNIYASLRRENRYAATDNEISGGFYQPIDERFSLQVEISVSPTHYVLPSRSFLGQIELLATEGWGASVGLRHTEYNTALMNLLSTSVERSWGNYRVAYTHFQGFWSAHGSTSSGQLQAAKYYGDRSWYGINFSDGSELDTLPSLLAGSTNVRTLIANGRHWLKPNLALIYAIGNSRHANFYSRNRLQLGLRHQF
jgi:YaiO family outer membrane protein